MSTLLSNVKNSKNASWSLSSTVLVLKGELFRKSLHVCIALVPGIASVAGVFSAVVLLVSGIIVYTISEALRLSGRTVPIIGQITMLAMRERDKGFVLGPVTLAIGALLALSLYPEPAAAIGIYSLAFGDGIASIAGKAFGTIKLPFTGGKSLEGSLACFLVVFLTVQFLEPSVTLQSMLMVALSATVLEALPSKDFDNILLPIGTGLVAQFIL